MSVLIEALSLVVRRITLDVSWPGGADAFLEAMCAADCPARRLCSDHKLVSVSFFTPDDAKAVVASLEERGLVELDGSQFYDIAIIDQREGPTMPCPWLEWKQHRDGFTYAWMAGEEPGDMAVPANWAPEQSRGLTRSDVRDEPGRMLKLSEDGDLETWLDFKTGKVTTGMKRLAERVRSEGGDGGGDAAHQELSMAKQEAWDSGSDDDADDEEGFGDAESLDLLETVIAALTASSVDHVRVGDDSIGGRVRTDKASYEIFINVDESKQTVFTFVVFPNRVPAARRSAVAELCTRINWRIGMGSIEMDFSDGDLRFRHAIDVEDGVLALAMVQNIVGAAVWTLDAYHDALVKVMISGEDPARAIAEVAE